jgi:pimeloyl-ACP methyl ester carboxylesterase
MEQAASEAPAQVVPQVAVEGCGPKPVATPVETTTEIQADEPQLKRVYALLVHGTWSDGGWTNADSVFRKFLTEELRVHGLKPRFEQYAWNGHNKHSARQDEAKSMAAHFKTMDDEGIERPVVITHSHGGNIAAEALLTHLKKHPQSSIRRVVTMGTPFLSEVPRSPLTHWVHWAGINMALCVLLVLSFVLVWETPASVNATGLRWVLQVVDQSVLSWELRSVSRIGLHGWKEFGWPLMASLLLAVVFLWVNHYIIRGEKRAEGVAKKFQEPAAWQRSEEPRFLCLASSEDEAISALNAAEGLSNVAHYLLHAKALLFLAGFALLLSFFFFDFNCLLELDCRRDVGFFVLAAAPLFGWVSFIFGIAGSFLLTKTLGKPLVKTPHLLRTRTLVTLKPLHFPCADFKPIYRPNTDARSGRWLGWLTDWLWAELTHSEIYSLRQTAQEVAQWIKDNDSPSPHPVLSPAQAPAAVHPAANTRASPSASGSVGRPISALS